MDIIPDAVGGVIVALGTCVCRYISPKIENIVRFSSKIENLSKEVEKLTKFRDDINGKVKVAEGEGYKPKPDVIKWIKDVENLEKEWKSMQGSIAAAKKLAYKCCPKCCLRWEVSTQAKNIREEICRLIEDGKNFGSNLVVENYQVKKVEFIPVRSIEGQPTAARNLNKILHLLEDDKVCIIGVLGMGGVGKTTLVKNLNNKLQKIDVSRSKLYFGVVVWVTVPKPTNISTVQAQIANRLNLKADNEGTEESMASKIYQRLKQEESFLLILDNVWDAIDLVHVGVPQPEDHTRSKVIITSRFLGVCKQMKTHTELNISKLDEDESWQLFVKNAGDSVKNAGDIQPLAKEITRECDGLPLAITVIGSSMSGKTSVELWEDALKSIRMSEPHNKVIKDKVYKVIKWSFDSLESQDIESSSEQRGKLVNKKRGDVQSCFLYCSLYPEAIATDDLIHFWWAEGFLGEHDTYEEAYNRGNTMIESLKDACLLETHGMDSVKMHDVVRDVAIWIDNSFGLTEISHTKVSTSVKRISAVSSKIELPDFCTECPETTTVLLQENHLKKIPHEFFFAFPALRVLNLSQTGISALPSSINSLCRLRALILQRCRWLKELPPIGNLHNLQLLDCDNTRLHCLPQELDKLTNLRLLNLPIGHLEESIGQGFFLKLPSIEMLTMLPSKMMDFFEIMRFNRKSVLGPAFFNEISSLRNLTSLFIRLDSSLIFNRDHTWMSRLKRFHIHVGSPAMHERLSKARRMISISKCEIFSNGELSGMLEFASELYLERCSGLRKLIENKSFNGLKSLYISFCSCDFGPVEEGSGQSDPLPNLEYLYLKCVFNLKSVSDFSQHVGLRFSKLRQLDIHLCDRLTCLFNIGGSFSVPKHLEEITITKCEQLVELLVQCSSSQATLVNSEIPRVQKLVLEDLPNLQTLGEPQSRWEHLEELKVRGCDEIKKLPRFIQTSKNIKVIEGRAEWWNQLAWYDNNSKSNLEHCFMDQS